MRVRRAHEVRTDSAVSASGSEPVTARRPVRVSRARSRRPPSSGARSSAESATVTSAFAALPQGQRRRAAEVEVQARVGLCRLQREGAADAAEVLARGGVGGERAAEGDAGLVVELAGVGVGAGRLLAGRAQLAHDVGPAAHERRVELPAGHEVGSTVLRPREHRGIRARSPVEGAVIPRPARRNHLHDRARGQRGLSLLSTIEDSDGAGDAGVQGDLHPGSAQAEDDLRPRLRLDGQRRAEPGPELVTDAEGHQAAAGFGPELLHGVVAAAGAEPALVAANDGERQRSGVQRGDRRERGARNDRDVVTLGGALQRGARAAVGQRDHLRAASAEPVVMDLDLPPRGDGADRLLTAQLVMDGVEGVQPAHAVRGRDVVAVTMAAARDVDAGVPRLAPRGRRPERAVARQSPGTEARDRLGEQRLGGHDPATMPPTPDGPVDKGDCPFCPRFVRMLTRTLASARGRRGRACR